MFVVQIYLGVISSKKFTDNKAAIRVAVPKGLHSILK